MTFGNFHSSHTIHDFFRVGFALLRRTGFVTEWITLRAPTPNRLSHRKKPLTLLGPYRPRYERVLVVCVGGFLPLSCVKSTCPLPWLFNCFMPSSSAQG